MKRLVKAQERAATALERIASANEAVLPDHPKKSKLAQVFVPATEEMNEIYREEHGW